MEHLHLDQDFVACSNEDRVICRCGTVFNMALPGVGMVILSQQTLRPIQNPSVALEIPLFLLQELLLSEMRIGLKLIGGERIIMYLRNDHGARLNQYLFLQDKVVVKSRHPGTNLVESTDAPGEAPRVSNSSMSCSLV